MTTQCDRTAIVFSKPNCPQCVQAKALLASRNVCVDERVVGVDVTVQDVIEAVGSVVRSVPQIVLDGTPISSVAALRDALAA